MANIGSDKGVIIISKTKRNIKKLKFTSSIFEIILTPLKKTNFIIHVIFDT